MTPAQLLSTRSSLGLTQSGLAERLGVDPRTIRKWEHGEREIPSYLHLALDNLRMLLDCERRVDALERSRQ